MSDHPTAPPAPDLDAAITRAGVADLTAAHHVIGPTALAQVRASLDDVGALVAHARAQAGEIARLRAVYDAALAWERARTDAAAPVLARGSVERAVGRVRALVDTETALRAVVRAALADPPADEAGA